MKFFNYYLLLKDRVGSCSGDSGGILSIFHPIIPRKHLQIGIVSAGPIRCGESEGYPGIYTKVENFTKWVLDNVET